MNLKNKKIINYLELIETIQKSINCDESLSEKDFNSLNRSIQSIRKILIFKTR